jgi:hypothetical protein
VVPDFVDLIVVYEFSRADVCDDNIYAATMSLSASRPCGHHESARPRLRTPLRIVRWPLATDAYAAPQPRATPVRATRRLYNRQPVDL